MRAFTGRASHTTGAFFVSKRLSLIEILITASCFYGFIKTAKSLSSKKNTYHYAYVAIKNIVIYLVRGTKKKLRLLEN